MAKTKDADWNKFWGSEGSQKFGRISWSKKRIIKVCEPFLNPGAKVLDAGCGSGFFSKVFCESNMQVVSLDYSDEALKMTKEVTAGRSQLIKADLLSQNLFELTEQKFGIIFTDGLLEHFTLSEQQKILANFSSVLEDNGVLITFVPNRFSPWQIIRPFFMPGIKETPFVLSDLEALHKASDLKVFHSGGINVVPFRFSPDEVMGRAFGMLLYVIAGKS